MKICHVCGEEIEFRYIDGEVRPIHINGWCPGSRSEYSKPSTTNYDGDFCRPTKCPICKANVFFIRYNGGSVYVDELGWPWPKHACFHRESYSEFDRLKKEVPDRGSSPFLGVIVQSEKTRSKNKPDIYTKVRVKGNSNEYRSISIKGDFKHFYGRLVMLISGKNGSTMKEVISGKIISYQITDEAEKQSDGVNSNKSNRLTKIEKIKDKLIQYNIQFDKDASYRDLKKLLIRKKLINRKIPFNKDASYEELRKLLSKEQKRSAQDRKMLRIRRIKSNLSSLEIPFDKNSSYEDLRELLVREQQRRAQENRIVLEGRLRELNIDFSPLASNKELRKLISQNN